MRVSPISEAGNIYNGKKENQKQSKKQKQNDKEKNEKFSVTNQKEKDK